MTTKLKRYTKEELLAILNDKCPDALAAVPQPSAFQFKMNKRDGVDNPALWVGHTVKGKSAVKFGKVRKIQDVLWLEEYDSEKYVNFKPRDSLSIPIGMSGLDAICRPAYGLEAKDNYQLQRIYMGMHYMNDDDVKVNGTVHDRRGFKGNDIFGRFSDRGEVPGPFCNAMRALFRFALLHCGHVDVYEEFLDGKGKVQGVVPLVRGLKELAKRAPGAEGAEGIQGDAEIEEQDDVLFVKESSGKKKRKLEGAGKGKASKKMRINANLMKALR